MHKGKNKKTVKSYDSGTLAFLAVLGMIMIALGVLSLLSVIGGLEGAIFTMVKEVMQGLGGGLCIGVSVLLVWGGLLVAFSSGRNMPKRGILLVTLIYIAVLGIVNVLSKVDEKPLLDYIIAVNNNANPPVANADGYWSVLKSSYGICAYSGSFGGALGMLLAWPAKTFLGVAIGTAMLVLVCIICVLLLSRFDLLGQFSSFREGAQERRARKEQERAQQEYQEMLEQQRRQAMENERLMITPAFRRRAKNSGGAEAAAEQGNQPPAPYPPYGSMLVQQQAAQAGGYYANPSAAFQPAAEAPAQAQPEMYDEIIIPQGRQLPWRRSEKKNKKDVDVRANAYQTQMTFTPREVGMSDDETGAQTKNEALILSGSKRKALERIEEIRKRKANIHLELEGNELQLQEMRKQPGLTPPPIARQAQPAPVVEDRNAAYRRPVQAPAEDIKPLASVQPSFAPSAQASYMPPAQPPAPKAAEPARSDTKPYVYPSIDLLNMQQHKATTDYRAQDTENAAKLEKTLDSFSIPARVQRVTHGPAITRFELGLVSSGVNVKRIMGIADNIALDMAANGGVRIEIPIPGTNLFGIEIPNKEIQSVTLAEVLMSNELQSAKSPLAVALGRDIAGKPVICDIAKMPHLLIAGQTGSGKSVCINAIINSILFRASPEDVRMIMIDPKVVELQCYNVVPHLLIPVVSDPHKASGALSWAVAEMLDRYHKMQGKNVRELSAYNAKLRPGEEKLPRIVIVIDELADLMLACKKEVEESIIRLAQLARAAGIHMIVATQRPTVDVITGLIKANIPSRIAFAVSSSIDSRTILDQNGAEKLLGRGDMFYFPTGASSPTRVQGCFLSDAETERVVDYIEQHSHVRFDPNVIEAMENEDETLNPLNDGGEESGLDDRLAEAVEMVIMDGQASISMLQRRMKIGYARAGRLIDDMATRGIVSKSAGSKPREVLMSHEEFERIRSTLC